MKRPAMTFRTWPDNGEGWRVAGFDPPGPALHAFAGLDITFRFRDRRSVSKIFFLGAA